MSKAWSHLPNAHHIDWVLASFKETPELWNAAWDTAWDTAAPAPAVWDAAGDAAWDTAEPAARAAAWDTAWDTAMSATWSAARAATWSAISALVAYDDCDKFLSMSYERLKVWAVLSEDPRAVLLLPMVYVKKQLLQEVVV